METRGYHEHIEAEQNYGANTVATTKTNTIIRYYKHIKLNKLLKTLVTN